MQVPAVAAPVIQPSASPSLKNYGKMLQHAIKTTNLVDIERAISGYSEQQIKVHELAVKKIEEMAAAKKSSPAKALAALKLETDILVKKLPNGELPLIFAVQENNAPVVEFLMKKGADPTLRDDRNFSALFCARYLNPSLSAILGSHYFSEEFSELKELFSDPKAMQQAAETLSSIRADIASLNDTVHTLVSSLNKKSSTTTTRLSSSSVNKQESEKIFQEKQLKALQQELGKNVDLNVVKAALEKLSSKGISPEEKSRITQELEKTVNLKALKAALEKLKLETVCPEEPSIKMYGLVNSTDLSAVQAAIEEINESELHYIVANCDYDDIENYLEVSANRTQLNKPNAHGFTPIYYALALERFQTAKLLLKHGAHMDFDHVISATTLIGAPDKTQHPSSINDLDMLYFVSSFLMWSSNLLVESYMTNEQKAENNTLALLGKAFYGLHMITSVYTTARLYGQMPPLLYVFFMTFKSLLFDFDHPLNTCIKVYEIAGFSMKAFSAFSEAWRNAAYGRGRALLKAVVVGLPNLHIALHRIKHFAIDQWIETSKVNNSKPVESQPASKKPERRRLTTTARIRVPRGNLPPVQVESETSKSRIYFPAVLPPASGLRTYFTKI